MTGAAGFVGRHVVERLREEGYKVAANDIRGEGLRMDMAAFLHGVLDFDLVVHCAGVVGGRTNIESNPLALMTENLRLDAALFAWAAKRQPGRLVYISSSAVYPTSYQSSKYRMKLEEDMAPQYVRGYDPPQEPDSTYGFEKMVGERLAEEYRAAGGAVTIVRPFSGYASDQDAAYPFPAILQRVRERQDPVTVWSNAVRDWIHIDDFVEGMLTLAQRGVNRTVNLCTGRGVSMTELAGIMQMVRGGDPAPTHICDGKPAGVAYRVGETSLMNLFFTPKISLEEGVERALRVR